MSERRDPQKPIGFLEQFQIPAVRTYIFVGLAALVVYYILMSGHHGGTGVGYGAMLTLVIAIPGLTSRWIISPILFIILVSFQLYDPDFQRLLAAVQDRYYYHSDLRPSDNIFEDALLAASILVYMMAHYRLMGFVHKSMPDDPAPRRKGQPEPDTPRRPPRLFNDRELGMLLAMTAIATLSGLILWFFIAGYESGERLAGWWGLSRGAARFVVFLWSVGTGAVLVGVTFRYLAMRRMSWLEARLIIQDQFYHETRREQERIYRWRDWFKRKSSEKSGGV